MKRLTAQWVRKAESDYRVAKKIARGSEPHHDEVCYHCQVWREVFKSSFGRAGQARATHAYSRRPCDVAPGAPRNLTICSPASDVLQKFESCHAPCSRFDLNPKVMKPFR